MTAGFSFLVGSLRCSLIPPDWELFYVVMNAFVHLCEQSCVAGTVKELVMMLINSWRYANHSSTSTLCAVSAPSSLTVIKLIISGVSFTHSYIV